MVVTWIVDFIWLVYWGPFWNSEEMKDWEKGVHSWTLFWSTIGFLFKLAVMICLCFLERDTLKNNLPTDLSKFLPGQQRSNQ